MSDTESPFPDRPVPVESLLDTDDFAVIRDEDSEADSTLSPSGGALQTPPTASGETGDTMPVYHDGREPIHLAGPNPGTPYTACGLDAGAMLREERPISWAGVWCTDCLRTGLVAG